MSKTITRSETFWSSLLELKQNGLEDRRELGRPALISQLCLS